MKKTIFTGAGVAIITPMNGDLSVNYDKLGELIDFQINNGTDAIVICGTTGESATLSHEEHTKAIDYTVKKVAGRVPVIAGTGSNDTRYAVELSSEAEKSGADALLLVTPYYNKTTQDGLIKHFTYIADRVSIPIILYNVPSRTGLNIKPATYLELSKHPNITAVKEANGDIASVAKTISLCGENLDVYSGSDENTIPIMSLGGKGVISVLSNILPKQTHDMCAAFLAGDVKKAASMQTGFMGMIDALFCETNPIPVKEAMNFMGLDVGECRLPLVKMQDRNAQALKSELKKYGLLG